MNKANRSILLTIKLNKFLLAAIVLTGVAVLACTIIFASLDKSTLSGKSIILDPGHGGVDGGTSDGRLFLEKDINLQIAGKIKSILESTGAALSMTRDKDIALDKQNNLSSSRHKRDLLARVAAFNNGTNDIFVSIHVNRSHSSKAIGPIVAYSDHIPESKLLAECIQKRLNLHIGKHLGKSTSRIPVKADFFILRNSKVPGVLVETGFISNSAEKKLLKDEIYQEKLAQHICDGIIDYFRLAASPSPETTPGDIPTQFNPEYDFPFDTIEDTWMVRSKQFGS